MVQEVWTQGQEIQSSGAHRLHALPSQGHYPCLLDPGSAIEDQNVITKLEEGWYFQLEFSEGHTAPFRNEKGPTKKKPMNILTEKLERNILACSGMDKDKQICKGHIELEKNTNMLPYGHVNWVHEETS